MKTKLLGYGTVLAALGLLFFGAATALPLPDDAGGAKSGHVYVGAKKCKLCHNAKSKGAQYPLWKERPHARAYARLAEQASKDIAAKMKIGDPQKSEQCLKCHLTAAAVAPSGLDKSFKRDDEAFLTNEGVGCEVCHGPGKDFSKTNIMKDRDKCVEKGLILPDEETCTACHNEESPTYRPFCYAHRLAEILHPVPNKEREEVIIKCSCEKKQDLKIKKDGTAEFIPQKPEKKDNPKKDE